VVPEHRVPRDRPEPAVEGRERRALVACELAERHAVDRHPPIGGAAVVNGERAKSSHFASIATHILVRGVGERGAQVILRRCRPQREVRVRFHAPGEIETGRPCDRKRGCRTIDGGGMMVWQAAGAFEHFTGVKPDATRMEGHFRNIVSHTGASP